MERHCHDIATARSVLAQDEICTNSTLWLDRVAPALLADTRPLVHVSCGTNKGYGVLSMLRRFANVSVTPRSWWLALSQYRKEARVRGSRKRGVTCGHCGGCEDDGSVALAARELAVHAIELLPDNVRWLRWAFAHFGLRVALTHAAVGNASGRVMTPNFGLGVGYEMARAGGASGHVGRMMRLDDYLEEEEVRHVHVLSMDLESWDGLALRGLTGSFAARRVSIVEFEAKRQGWGAETARQARLAAASGELRLDQTVRWLGSFGYGCFFQTKSGCVVPVSGACWQVAFGPPTCGGNGLCAVGTPLTLLWNLSDECARCSVEQMTALRGGVARSGVCV